MSILSAAGLALVLCGMAASLTGRLPAHRVNGLMGLGNGLISLSSINRGEWLWALLNASACAVCLWLWWHGGGGDDTRRRLRCLRRRFHGVRRTAPATA
ncbi:hypothetical protein [Streptomyces sp. NPDC002328]|uniref:hypothetical protein n=1 Tax=Streptomyces sp. NPDC002328 TaxID=3364642 RepID=UPI00367F298A